MKLDAFTRAYIECALWSTMDESNERGGEPLDRNYSAEDIALETLARMIRDCAAFQEMLGEAIDAAPLMVRRPRVYSNRTTAGHDFWLTRNGHGAGFWDGDWPECLGETLTQASKAFGEMDLYVGDDGLIYSSGGRDVALERVLGSEG